MIILIFIGYFFVAGIASEVAVRIDLEGPHGLFSLLWPITLPFVLGAWLFDLLCKKIKS